MFNQLKPYVDQYSQDVRMVNSNERFVEAEGYKNGFKFVLTIHAPSEKVILSMDLKHRHTFGFSRADREGARLMDENLMVLTKHLGWKYMSTGV